MMTNTTVLLECVIKTQFTILSLQMKGSLSHEKMEKNDPKGLGLLILITGKQRTMYDISTK
jgi:hypothetical protein